MAVKKKNTVSQPQMPPSTADTELNGKLLTFKAEWFDLHQAQMIREQEIRNINQLKDQLVQKMNGVIQEHQAGKKEEAEKPTGLDPKRVMERATKAAAEEVAKG